MVELGACFVAGGHAKEPRGRPAAAAAIHPTNRLIIHLNRLPVPRLDLALDLAAPRRSNTNHAAPPLSSGGPNDFC